MPSIKIGDIIGKITSKIKIPKRKSKEESSTETPTQVTQVAEVQEVQNPFEKKGRNLPNLPIKKIIIIAPIIVIVGLLVSGIIPINLAMPQEQMEDFEFINDRVNFLEDQMDFILSEGLGSAESGKQGPSGPPGKQGSQGIAGEDGKDGVGGIPIMLSSAGTKTQLSQPLYIGVGGGSEDYELIKMVSPTDGVITNLYILTSKGTFNDVNDNVRGMLILNGEETELYCHVIKNKCSNTESIIEIKAGDALAIRIDKQEQILSGELLRVQASVILEPED